jgi:hypothetical protein
VVGSCSNCNRPYYAPDDRILSQTCKGCGSMIGETAEPTRSWTPPSERTEPARERVWNPPSSNRIAAPRGPVTFEEAMEQVQTEAFVEQEIRKTNQFAFGCIAVGLGLLFAAGAWAYDTWRFKESAQRIQGTADGAERWKYTSGTKTIYHIEYYAGGRKQSLRTLNTYTQGEKVQLLVSPNDPTDARIPDDLWENKIGIAVFGGLTLALGLLLLMKR